MRTVRCALLGLLLSLSPGVTAEYPWEEEPASRWTRDFSHSARDNRVPLPTTQLEQEGIGEKVTVHDVFDRWVLNESVSVGRGTHFAEVTKDCKGKIELDFALTPTQWQNPARQKRYYRSVDRLVTKVGRQLLADFGHQLSGREKAAFMRALHALAWQESLWQHAIRYKNCFMEYYLVYMNARSLPCNDTAMDKLVGAYNQYASGFSYCHGEFSEDETFRTYQIRAMTGFGNHYENRTWLKKMK